MVAVALPGANVAAGVTTCNGKDFPNELKCNATGSEKDYVLLTTGTRTKLLFKVYALAVYVDKKKLEATLKALGGKAGVEKLQKDKKLGQMLHDTIQKNKIAVKVVMVFLRDLTGKQMVEGLGDSLKEHMEKTEFEGAKEQIVEVLPADTQIKENDCLSLELHTPKGDAIRALREHKEVKVHESAVPLVNAVGKIYFTTTLVNDCKSNLEKTVIALAA